MRMARTTWGPIPGVIFQATLNWPPRREVAVGQNPWYHFGVGEFTTHSSLFWWGLGFSLGVGEFDPWPNGYGSKLNQESDRVFLFVLATIYQESIHE